MSKNEMIERTRQALERFDRLPADEQVRQLVEHGAIDPNGEVLLGRKDAEREETERNSSAADRARSLGTPSSRLLSLLLKHFPSASPAPRASRRTLSSWRRTSS